jgi:hypothetical protein
MHYLSQGIVVLCLNKFVKNRGVATQAKEGENTTFENYIF